MSLALYFYFVWTCIASWRGRAAALGPPIVFREGSGVWADARQPGPVFISAKDRNGRARRVSGVGGRNLRRWSRRLEKEMIQERGSWLGSMSRCSTSMSRRVYSALLFFLVAAEHASDDGSMPSAVGDVDSC